VTSKASRSAIQRSRLGKKFLWLIYALYIMGFLVYLYAPLAVTGILSFNDNNIPSFPWKGFTSDWYYNPEFESGSGDTDNEAAGGIASGASGGTMGVFNDVNMMASIKNSFIVAVAVTALSLIIGLSTAFLFERNRFFGDSVLYFIMIAPLVVPGVILGVSILSSAHSLAVALRELFGRDLVRPITNLLRPGLFIVTLGQFAWIATLATMIISARLRRFPTVQEDAAMDLGASRFRAIFSVTIPYLMPALFSAGIVAFMLSFENFGTTLFLIGADPTLPILFFSRLRFSVTPEINAVSLVLMAGTVILGIVALGLGQLRSSALSKK
jgi:spermidine/putrescine transport system permease protein